jgi:UDP-N-acetyl-D-mannosaminuronate dehydrogenase
MSIHKKLVKGEAKLAVIGLGYVGLPIALSSPGKFL